MMKRIATPKGEKKKSMGRLLDEWGSPTESAPAVPAKKKKVPLVDKARKTIKRLGNKAFEKAAKRPELLKKALEASK